MLTSEAEAWAEIGGGDIGVVEEEESSLGFLGEASWLPTKEMLIICGGVVGLIVMCCLIKACHMWC